jgi:hypothetical protein
MAHQCAVTLCLTMSMETDSSRVVAVLGRDPSFGDLIERLRLLGHRTLRADGFEDAGELAEVHKLRFSAVLLDPAIQARTLRLAVNQFRQQTHSASLVYLAAGPPPESVLRGRLRDAGVELAVWDPVSDHDLRFQLNRAVSGWTHEQLRGEQRAPINWNTRVVTQGREKMAHVYTISGSGAFLATRRPSLEGADLLLELPLPSGATQVTGRVVYTNVPGTNQLTGLPDGMAVQFESPPQAVERAIRDSVDAKALELAV